MLDVPIATYGPSNSANPALPPVLIPIANLNCRLSGTVTPFDDATLDALYPDHGTYVSQVARRTNELQRERFLLPADAQKIKTDAALSRIGCGGGFAQAAVVVPIVWLHGWRRRRRATR
jgi:hypothetical protein